MDKEIKLSEKIREIIRTIPVANLPRAKPRHVLPQLEAAGFEITTSVRSTVSKLLKKAKQEDNPSTLIARPKMLTDSETKTEWAMKLVETCNGDFSEARRQIDFVENIANRCLALPKNENKGEE